MSDLRKFALARKISEFLKLGEDGKLDSFFSRVEKTLKKEISAHNKNLDILKFNYEQELDTLEDRLEDAKAALVNAYMKVEVAEIGNNAKEQAYMEVYLENIDNHEIKVQEIEQEIEIASKEYQEAKTGVEAQIASSNKRIVKITEE